MTRRRNSQTSPPAPAATASDTVAMNSMHSSRAPPVSAFPINRKSLPRCSNLPFSGAGASIPTAWRSCRVREVVSGFATRSRLGERPASQPWSRCSNRTRSGNWACSPSPRCGRAAPDTHVRFQSVYHLVLDDARQTWLTSRTSPAHPPGAAPSSRSTPSTAPRSPPYRPCPTRGCP